MPRKVKYVLIVDDETSIAKAIDLKLRNLGLTTKVVGDGVAALDSVKESEYDLMLLDLAMPKLDGFGVLEALHKSGGGPTVIVVTNFGETENVRRAKALGAKSVIIKSDISLDDLAKSVTGLRV